MDYAIDKTKLQSWIKEIGPRARVSLGFNMDLYQGEKILSGLYYPLGSGGENPYTLQFGDSVEEFISACNAWWDKISQDSMAEMIRKIALKIIELTALNGECSDAALRQDFDQAYIDKLGREAIIMANKMASNGPFSIKEAAKSNAE